MKKELVKSNAFIRAARQKVKKNPKIAEDVKISLELLEKDAFHHLLKTHKLKGDFKDSWACSVGYDLRIIFKFVQYKGTEAILLEAIGTHEEVY
ncbi:MAG: type II toxin-antitoxin system mRNA interferase toxin, RelE/StbE family [bacterium]